MRPQFKVAELDAGHKDTSVEQSTAYSGPERQQNYGFPVFSGGAEK
ncbi:hypothetical protein ACFXDO_33525 [Streptomyces nigra]